MGVAPRSDDIRVSQRRPVVLLVGTFDTKGEEYAFVRGAILDAGVDVLTVDLGVLGTSPVPFPVEVTAADVALDGGATIEALRASADRGHAVEVMQTGARKVVRRLFDSRRFDGILGLGGGGGTAMITTAMRELPVGVPKVMVSTMASGNTAPYVDVKDITMMYSVVDIAGLNAISRVVLANAAGAICGMVARRADAATDAASRSGNRGGGERGAIAATMFGVTTPCVTTARKRLEGAGFDVVVFHATGSGGRAMEGLIDDGYFSAVLDVTTTEWCDEVVGGVLSAGPDRLSAAARAGIPQVVSVGALDMVNFGAMSTVPERFRARNLYKHNDSVTLMRTTPDECREIGRRIGEKLSGATGPVTLMIPARGVSMLDAPGKLFHDPDADRVLFESLRRHCAGSAVEIRELDAHVNDESFGLALADQLLGMLQPAVRA